MLSLTYGEKIIEFSETTNGQDIEVPHSCYRRIDVRQEDKAKHQLWLSVAWS